MKQATNVIRKCRDMYHRLFQSRIPNSLLKIQDIEIDLLLQDLNDGDFATIQSKFDIFNSIHLDSNKQKTMTPPLPPQPILSLGKFKSYRCLSGWPNIVLRSGGRKNDTKTVLISNVS